VGADRTLRSKRGAVTETLGSLWKDTGAEASQAAIITGATGAEPATSEERSFLEAHKAIPVRATGTRFGHIMEGQFPLGIALAALSLARGSLFPPADSSPFEIAMTAAPTQIVVIGTGHWRGEGMALVEAVK
jgi:3-oxoacyl-[acyl-carrier-protein] synthase II